MSGRGRGRGTSYREPSYRDYRDRVLDNSLGRLPQPPLSSLLPPPVLNSTLPPRLRIDRARDIEFYGEEERSSKRSRFDFDRGDESRRQGDTQKPSRSSGLHSSRSKEFPPHRRDSGARSPEGSPREDSHDMRRSSNSLQWTGLELLKRDQREKDRGDDREKDRKERERDWDRDRGEREEREPGEVLERVGMIDRYHTINDRRGSTPVHGGRAPLTVLVPAQSPAVPSMCSSLLPQLTTATSTVPALSPRPRSLASAIVDASYASIKLQQAREAYQKADSENTKHSEHYAAFPLMRERYEGILQEAKQAHARINAEFESKSVMLNQELQKFAAKQSAAKESEEAIRLAQSLAQELGSSTLEQFVQRMVSSELKVQVEQQVRAQIHSYLPPEKLEGMKSSISDIRHNMTILGDHSTDLDILKDNVQNVRKAAEDGKKLVESAVATQCDINMRLEKVCKSVEEIEIGMSKMSEEVVRNDEKINSRVEERTTFVDSVLKDAAASLEGIIGRVDALKTAVDQQNEAITQANRDVAFSRDEIEAIKRAKSMDRPQTPTNADNHYYLTNKEFNEFRESLTHDMGASNALYATAEDLHHVETARNKMFDEIKAHIEATETEVGNEISSIQSDIAALKGKVTTNHDSSQQELNAVAAELNNAKQYFQLSFTSLDQKLNSQPNFCNNLGADISKLRSDVSSSSSLLPMVQTELQAHQNRLEGLSVAFKHLDERLNEWNAKEFYERLVHLLLQRNPVLLNQGMQVQSIMLEQKRVQQSVVDLQNQMKQHLNKNVKAWGSSPHQKRFENSEASTSNGDGNKETETNNSSGDLSLHDIMKALQSQVASLNEIKQRLDDHIQAYHAKMTDIREWTISATKRMSENSDSATTVKDEIRKLYDFLRRSERDRQDSCTPHLPSPATNSERWRAINSHQTEPLRGLPDDGQE